MTSFNFTYSEEAFLLGNLQEVVKVWARGTGRASFNFNVCDGGAELALSFSLGLPSDLHCSPPSPPSHADHQHEQHHPRRRHKGPAQRERDRLRAEAHRSRQKITTAAPAVDVILPFAGKIVPMKVPNQQPVVEGNLPAAAAPAATSVAGASSVTPVAAVSAVTPPATVHPAAVRPTKSVSTPTLTIKNIDVDLAKKQLFPPPPRQVPPSSQQLQPAANKKKCYKKKEDDLWTKLFVT